MTKAITTVFLTAFAMAWALFVQDNFSLAVSFCMDCIAYIYSLMHS